VAGLRRAASWLASPLTYPSLQLARQARCRVLLGPFAGMRYPFGFLPRGIFVGAPQAGTYESELHETIEGVVAAAPAALVNIGSAEGYYAIGLARRLPHLRVIAFEADPGLRSAAGQLAALNDVADRVELRGTCTPEELGRVNPLGEVDAEFAAGSVCVIIDCEGCEAELADPERVEWLRRASLLVELHTAIDAAIEQRLVERLSATHETTVVRARPPWAGRWPELSRLRGLRAIDRELLVAEFRHGGQDWIWATPR